MKRSLYLNRALAFITVLALLFTVNAAVVFADTMPQGSGTAEEPYLVGSKPELEALSALSESEPIGYITLTDDIDMQGEEKSFVIKELTGTFNGNGFTIKNLSIAGGSGGSKWNDPALNTGLIQTLSGNVQNLKTENVTVTGVGNKSNAGIIAGFIPAGANVSIDNCIINGKITSSAGNSYTNIGGFVGYVEGSIDDNTVFAVNNSVQNVEISAPSGTYAGGILGSVSAYTNMRVEKCAILGAVSGSATAGGIAGWFRQSSNALTLTDSYLGSKLTGSKKYGIASNTSAFSTEYPITITRFFYDSEKNPSPSSWSSFDMVKKGNDSVKNLVNAKDTAGIKALAAADEEGNSEITGFEVRTGEFSDYPVPVWKTPAPIIPPQPQFSCTAVFNGTYDGEVNVYFGEAMPENLVSPVNGKYILTEKGSYSYTVTGCKDYNDLTDGTFTLGDGDNETEKNIWVKLSYKLTELTGDGSEQSPYLIKTARELCTLAQKVNDGECAESFVTLENDITVGGSWTPLGKNSVYPFRGVFDGAGHSVTVTVDNARSYYGFFGCITDATVKNLTVNGEIYCGEPGAYTGGIAGRARGNVTIENVTNNANVSALARSSEGIGGIAGGYDDNVEYVYQSIRLVIKDSVNNAPVLVTGSGENAYVGGILGSNKNCAQIENCTNAGDICAPGAAVGGILGQAGYSAGDFTPKISNCAVTGALTGASGKVKRLYAKGSLSQAYVTGSGDNEYSGGDITNNLLIEANKYQDVVTMPSNAAVGYSPRLVKEGEFADSNITLFVTREESDITKGYITAEDNAVKLAKLNEVSQKTQEETVTLRFTDENGASLRKPVTVNIYPSDTQGDAQEALMHRIAQTYAQSSDDWTVFDMAVYKALGFGENTTDVENYLNLTVNSLAGSTPLVTDRAKAEIIFAMLGRDTENLTPYGSEESYSNAQKLAQMNLGSSHYAAPWVLLAEQAGKVTLSDSQRSEMIAVLTSAQGENGLFCSIYKNEKYDDADTTATAVAALAKYKETDTAAAEFIQKAVDGLSAAQGANGSYGNINTDAMVIIGLAAVGINPETDGRFIKNGCSLKDAVMLYVNDSGDGFTTGYATGERAEKARALATEQGFRALIVLNELKNCTAFNVYTLEQTGASVPIAPVTGGSFIATAPGNAVLPEDVTITPSGETNKNITATLLVVDENNNVWTNKSAALPNGATAADLIKKIFADEGISAEGIAQGYIKSVTKGNITLEQFDKGKNSGWMYKINSKTPSVGIADYTLKDGDGIKLYYTEDWMKEQETESWSGGGSGKSDKTADENTVYTITFVTNGAGEMTPVTAKKGESFKKPVNPELEGFVFDGWYTDKALTVKYNFSDAAKGNITLYAKWKQIEKKAEIDFKDVLKDAWYKEYVEFVFDNGLMKGTSDTEFEPEGLITRAMIATVLYRMEGEPEAKRAEFKDTDENEWYFNAVSWANENKIVMGDGDNMMRPNDYITREEMALMIYRYALLTNCDTSVGEETNILSYSDFNDISEYAIAALQFTAGSKIMTGKSESVLAPAQTATRAEAAAIITRFFTAYK